MKALRWLVTGFVVFEVAGNIAILIAHLRARSKGDRTAARWGVATQNAYQVTPVLWRSGRPSAVAYQSMAAAGVTKVIDLRAEGGSGPDADVGVTVVWLPIRDGQAPDVVTIERFRRELDGTTQPVLVHCAAGVGRTGSMVAARLVIDEGWNSHDALREALEVGPPSLEQIDFIIGLPARLKPRPLAVAVSRVLDAPRRVWSRIRSFGSR